MQRILVLGGGVGGTLVANLISRKIRRRIDAGEAQVTVVDQTGQHVYQPGFMYIAMGDQDPRSLRKPERRLLDDRVDLVVGDARLIDEEHRQVELGDGTRIDYDELERLAHEHRPKMIMVGASAYPREIDFERIGKVGRAIGTPVVTDMAHIAGLVAAKIHPSPIPHSDFVTTTTHKTLRGPRGRAARPS